MPVIYVYSSAGAHSDAGAIDLLMAGGRYIVYCGNAQNVSPPSCHDIAMRFDQSSAPMIKRSQIQVTGAQTLVASFRFHHDPARSQPYCFNITN